MEQVRKVLPYLVQGAVLCLFGFGYWLLSRKLSSVNSPESLDQLETALAELKGWKRTVESELESQFDRIRSVAGRVDRAKRAEKTSQDPPGEAQEAPDDLNDQGKLNAMLASRMGLTR